METVHGTLVESAGYKYRSRYKEHKDGLENMNEKGESWDTRCEGHHKEITEDLDRRVSSPGLCSAPDPVLLLHLHLYIRPATLKGESSLESSHLQVKVMVSDF